MDPLLQFFMFGLQQDPEPEVRANAAFAMGILAERAGAALYPYYHTIMSALHDAVAREGGQRTRVTDNVVASVCRLVLAGTDQVPLQSVLGPLLGLLPLAEDMDEWATVCRCLMFCTQQRLDQVAALVPHMVQGCSAGLQSDIPPGIQKKTKERRRRRR